MSELALTATSVCARGRLEWKTTSTGGFALDKGGSIVTDKELLWITSFLGRLSSDVPNELWTRRQMGVTEDKRYVVETNTAVLQRCILMTTDPGDLVLDPTCGSGTTAFVAEQWGRRWITIDTSRVALALAALRIMGARYPFYLLADSREGQRKEAEVSGRAPS